MKTILVPIDFSDVMPRVLDEAEKLARAFEATLLLLHVAPPEPEFVGYDPGPQSVRDSVAQDYNRLHHQLQEIERSLQARSIQASALLEQGYPVEQILAEAKRHDTAWIVMGSHGHGMPRQLLVGSVTEGVLRGSPCPVVTVPSHRTP